MMALIMLPFLSCHHVRIMSPVWGVFFVVRGIMSELAIGVLSPLRYSISEIPLSFLTIFAGWKTTLAVVGSEIKSWRKVKALGASM